MNAEDRARIALLVEEGKSVTRIQEEDFPQYDYWEILFAAAEDGQRPAMGIKRMISNRLRDLEGAGRRERRELIAEISNLVSQLYRNHKAISRRLEGVRKALDR